MRKTYLHGLLLGLVLSSTNALADNKAVEISIGGIGPAVDAAAFQTVQQVIGSAVTNGVIDTFMVSGYGKEGGYSACAQASPMSDGFGLFVKQLRAISPNRKTTAYSVKTVEACGEIISACTLEVNECPDGSFVGRVPPSCEFAPCPGK